MHSAIAPDSSRDAKAGALTASAEENRPSRPRLRALHLALQKTTEVLAHELATPTGVAPEWSEIEWAVARAAAALHGVSPLLAGTLRWQGPAPWAQFLAEQRAHTAQRFQRIQQLLQTIDHRSREVEVPLLPLKGAALHALGIYTAGERPMADLDLLVREEQSQATLEMLAGLGFRETYRTWKHRVLEEAHQEAPAALGEHAANSVKIELHCHVSEKLPLRVIDASPVVFPQRPHPGLNSYPSNAALMIHLALHAAGALIFRGLRLLQLHDIARLSERMTDEDWEEVLRESARMADGSLWWAYPPLTLAARYYGCVPRRVLARAEASSPRLLRRVYRYRTLAGASPSHLWVSAFPGIEWARSSREMLDYAATRLMPSAETLSMRGMLAKTQPLVFGGTWGQLSQSQRILRWMTSRQPRYATLQPVRAALGDARYEATGIAIRSL